ncbi:hypothetical protein [Marisediminicola sp. LYQ134]|uniref:hypothetical protein n=1 Tax=Marisediminicola sp. LYQ134 TaxID=3391061 RepID=UPI003982E551
MAIALRGMVRRPGDVRASRASRLLVVTATALTLLGLTGCQTAEVLWLDASETTHAPCPEIRLIPVEELDAVDPPGCRPVGSTLVFPDGTQMSIEEGVSAAGTESSVDPRKHSWIDVGDYGLVAAQANTTECSAATVWGRDEAIQKVVEAFGESWPCD